MPACENCQAEVLSDAQYCEACGHKIGTPSPKAEKEKGPTTERLSATPGSLRSEIPFLSGIGDQAKVRFDNWKNKGEQAKKEAERQQDLKKQEQEAARKERSGRGSSILNFLVGLAALCAFVYLLIRLPRKGASPMLVMQLWEAWKEEF